MLGSPVGPAPLAQSTLNGDQMKALISPIELDHGGQRVVQVCDDEFPVAPPLFWVDCPDEIKADDFRYANNQFVRVERLPTTVVRTMTSLQFMSRFTDDEQLAIVTQTMTNPVIKLWYDRLIAATEVIPGDERLIAGIGALVQHGLISEERANEVLAA